MGRAVKITLILAFVGVVVVTAIATTLVFHFKGKTDSAAESNLTTTIQQSISMTSSTRDSSSSSRVSTPSTNGASSTTVMNGVTTTMNPVTTVSAMSTTRISTSTIQNVPINLTVTQFSSNLISSSQSFCRSGTCTTSEYYFEAFLLNVTTTGFYTIKTNSSLDTYGYLYNNTFNPFTPTLNLIQSDDDNGSSSQFMLTMTLQASIQYTVVVTTYYSSKVGSYALIITGPASVAYSKINRAGLQSQQSVYSSALTASSSSYCRAFNCTVYGNQYYTALYVNVSMNASYLISCNSTFNTIVYIYNNYFNASAPLQDRIAMNDDGAGDSQFALYFTISPISKYILVVTTYDNNRTGPFTLMVNNPGMINFSVA